MTSKRKSLLSFCGRILYHHRLDHFYISDKTLAILHGLVTIHSQIQKYPYIILYKCIDIMGGTIKETKKYLQLSVHPKISDMCELNFHLD